MPESAFHQAQLTAANQVVLLDVRGYAGAVIQLTGTWVGTVAFEASADGVTFVALNGVPSAGSTPASTSTGNGAWVFGIAGFQILRARVSAFTSGIIVPSLRADPAGSGGAGGSGGGGGGGTSSDFGVAFPSTGTAIGFEDSGGDMAPVVLEADGSLPVTIVSGGTGGGAVTIANGADVAEGATTDVAVTGDNDGTVSAKLRGLDKILADVWDSANSKLKVSASSLPLPTGAATEATLSTLNGKVTAVNTGAVVVASSALPAGAATAAKQPALGTAGTSSVDVLSVQGVASGTPLPISAAALPLPTGAATAALQTQPGVDIGDVTVNNAGGAAAVPIQDGGNSITVDAASLPLPTGASTLAEQQIQSASLSVLDDWDESDRAKVNPIVGQAGIAAGAGAVGVTVPRVTLASDDPAVATLGAVAGAKVITDANGTLQQYLRGLVYLLITPLAALVTIARKFVYGAVVTLTTTNFSGLTNTSGWQSVSIATGGASEIQFLLETLGAAGSTAYVDFYLAEAFTSGSFTDGATGSEGTFTASSRKNSRYIGSVLLNTTTAVRGMLKYTDVSGSLPERVALIAVNNSGGTISATGGNTVFGYELIN